MFKDVEAGDVITVRFGGAAKLTGTVLKVSEYGNWADFAGGITVYGEEGWEIVRD